MNVIYILWLRQIKRYLRSKSRIIGSLGQPLLFFVAFGFGFGPIYQKAGGGNYLNFLAPGVIGMSILFTAVFSGIEMIWDRQFGFLKETFVAPVPRYQIVIGRIFGGATVATLQGLIVLILTIFLGFKIEHYYFFPLSLGVMFLIALLFTSLGTAIASIIEDMHGFQLIVNLLIMPIFFLSGAMFPLNGLPKALQIVTTLDPLTYGIDALRFSLTSAGQFSLSLNLGVLVLANIIIISLATYLFSKIRM